VLTTTVRRDFHDPETLRAALETLLVVFMYEDHPVKNLPCVQDLILSTVSFRTNSAPETAGYLYQGSRYHVDASDHVRIRKTY
jgi:hypothetical protein